MTSLRQRAHLVVATASFALVAAGCSADAALTLADVGAADLAGQNGDGVGARCSTLPLPETAVMIDCADGAGRSVSDKRLEPGTYAVVLLCETSGSYTLRPEHPDDLFEEVVVECPDGEDPAVAPAFELAEPVQSSIESDRQTSGGTVAYLVRQDTA